MTRLIDAIRTLQQLATKYGPGAHYDPKLQEICKAVHEALKYIDSELDDLERKVKAK